MISRLTLALFVAGILWQTLGFTSSVVVPNSDLLDAHIDLMMQVEPSERLFHITDYGIDIFTVPVPGAKSNNFPTLKQIPKGLSRWIGDFADGSTAGLYLTPKNSTNGVQVPTILIAEDAEPWALVHEFVHALLDEQRGTHSVIHDDESKMVTQLEDAREDLNELWWRYKQLGSFRSVEERETLMNSFLVAAGIERELISVFQMEEILIEGMLRRSFARQKPKDFKQETVDFSQIYIQQNAKKAQQFLEGTLQKCPDLQSLAKELPALQERVKISCQSSQELSEQIRLLEKAALR